MAQRSDWVLHSEYLDWTVTEDSLTDKEWADYIAKKYQNIQFAAVLSEATLASSFINTYGDELFGNVPKIMYSVKNLEKKSNSYYLISHQTQSVTDTFNLAKSLKPGSRKIVIINNLANIFGKDAELLRQLASDDDMAVSIIDDFSREELLSKMTNLKGGEIVFYFLVYSDNTGEKFIPGRILEEVCAYSPAPVFSFWGSLMGTGLAGGVMLDGSKISAEMFRAADDFMTNGTFSDDYSTVRTCIDWNTVKKHNLKVKNLEEKIEFINKPAPFFSVYYKEILLLGIAVLIIILIITLYSRYRIKKIYTKLEDSYWLQERHARMGEMMNFIAHQWQ